MWQFPSMGSILLLKCNISISWHRAVTLLFIYNHKIPCVAKRPLSVLEEHWASEHEY